LVACSTDSTAAPTTAAPTTAAPTTAVATTSTHVHPSTTSSATPTTDGHSVDGLDAQLSVADLPTAAPCAMGDVPVDGQTTFVVNGRLWGLDSDGSVACLADLDGRNPSWISWSPDGDEVLVGPDTVLRNDGRFVSSGYFPDNRSLRWSYPTGKALIAPNAETGHLIWRNAHDNTERIDVSFAERTTTAAYHPAGKHIAAAGIGSDGAGEGVFIASNRGANMQRIGQIEAGEVSDLSFEENGNSIVFLHHHPDGVDEVHRFDLAAGFLESIDTYTDAAVADLVSSPVDQGANAWSVARSTVSGELVVQVGPVVPAVRAEMPAEHLPQPLSWLPMRRLLVASHPVGAAPDAAFDLWQWSTGATTHVIDGVSAAAARTVHGPYLELNIIVGSGFG
jgi:dipeptidyl aminopeptidase/acylaminoacyl peptidase